MWGGAATRAKPAWARAEAVSVGNFALEQTLGSCPGFRRKPAEPKLKAQAKPSPRPKPKPRAQSPTPELELELELELEPEPEPVP